jgi:hypothetical protein
MGNLAFLQVAPDFCDLKPAQVVESLEARETAFRIAVSRLSGDDPVSSMTL